MYYLIDEIYVEPKYKEIFLKKISYFRRLYKSIKGVTSVTYTRTTIEAIRENTKRDPQNSYLLIITFDHHSSFQAYHDKSDVARTIHEKIARYFDHKQIPISISLHGDTKLNAESTRKK